jgi:hypothetical protein
MKPSTKRKIFSTIFLFCLAIILAGMQFTQIGLQYVLHSNAENTHTHILESPASLPNVVVMYTNDGFVPNDITIPLGTHVEFRNVSDIPMWTASDPHPTHTDYPEFDADKDFNNGETFIFQFTRTGTFGFHNHEKSLHRGIVHVFDPENKIPDISKTVEGQRTLRDSFLNMLKPGDSNSIFTVVDAIEANSSLSLACHDIAHDIGHRSYELYGFSGAMAFSNPQSLSHASLQDICAGGYIHGILEELSLHEPDFKDHPGNICEGVPSNNKATCFHGVGHALMFSFKRNVSSSLDACRSLDAASKKTRCFEGVWMELFWGNTAHTGSDSLGWELDKPLEPCKATEDDAKPACFLYSSFGYLRTHSKDYSGAINNCLTSDLQSSDAEFCVKGVGITMVSYFKGHNLERSESFAKNMSYYQKYAFYQGIIGYADFSGISTTELATTCDLFTKDKSICQDVLKNIR